MKLIHILHQRYHPKIIENILKISKKVRDNTINHNENEDDNEK